MEKGHCLELAEGCGWNIVPSEEAVSWVRQFAGIMQLDERLDERYPNLFIARKHDPNCSSATRVRSSRHVRFHLHDTGRDITCDIGEFEDQEKEFLKMWEILLPIYGDVKQSGGMPIHSALVHKNGKGVLLAATGGTGKSTCCRRIPAPWRALCDDESLVRRDAQNGYVVHPFPTWSEYIWKRSSPVWNVREAVPLVGIFFLQQSEKDEAIPIGHGEAALMIYALAGQTCWCCRVIQEQEENRASNVKSLDSAAELVRAVPSFKLKLSLGGCFWEEIEKVLKLTSEA
jgi:SynChlorMet cassette protein ScmC